MAIYEHWRPAGFEVAPMNAVIEREARGVVPEPQDEPISPRDWLRILSELRRRCEEEGIEYPFEAEDEKRILAGAIAPT